MEDRIDWGSMYVLADKLGLRGYQQKYFKECKYIWQHMVPKSGQADTLQGELLREAEKLRNEACDNGNINWDDNFAWFCDHLEEVLCGCGLFDPQECGRLREILAFIKKNGEYARDYGEGRITDDECDPAKLAYTDDDLYDYLEDAIAGFYLANQEPLPYEHKAFIYR